MICSHRWINKIWTTSKNSSNSRRIVHNNNVLEVLSVMVLRQLNNKTSKSLKDTNCIKNIGVRRKYLKNNHIFKIQNASLNKIKELILFYLNKLKKIMILLKLKIQGLILKKNNLYLLHIMDLMLANCLKRCKEEIIRCINLFLTKMLKRGYHQ